MHKAKCQGLPATASRLLLAASALALALFAASCGAARAPVAEAERIAELLELAPGMSVADVGAGDGLWSEDMARRVGDTGHVYATEVTEELLDSIRRRIKRSKLRNITVIAGDESQTGLSEGCCDSILLRLVYHHLTDPTAMRAGLHRALRPGGLIVVIELEPQEQWGRVAGVPDRGGHGISPEDLIAEMSTNGFEVVTRYDDWDGHSDRYCIVFRR
jgi:protein-L-isoaspartate O-methyltransferase